MPTLRRTPMARIVHLGPAAEKGAPQLSPAGPLKDARGPGAEYRALGGTMNRDGVNFATRAPMSSATELGRPRLRPNKPRRPETPGPCGMTHPSWGLVNLRPTLLSATGFQG